MGRKHFIMLVAETNDYYLLLLQQYRVPFALDSHLFITVIQLSIQEQVSFLFNLHYYNMHTFLQSKHSDVHFMSAS